MLPLPPSCRKSPQALLSEGKSERAVALSTSGKEAVCRPGDLPLRAFHEKTRDFVKYPREEKRTASGGVPLFFFPEHGMLRN